MDNNDKHTVKENVMNVRLQQDQAWKTITLCHDQC